MVTIPEKRSVVLTVRITPTKAKQLRKLARTEKTTTSTLASIIISENLDYLNAEKDRE